ncbi:hypothetical protein [Leyella lascolaii]|uniref:hypothetical protein n=1 Tax=Leyella lascolaii TaxID=1776379 RepID=UPI00083A218E|nr:hypothetical protein [Leyella lascolaii]
MKMHEAIFVFIVLLMLCGCHKDKFRDFDRMVLNNKVLEREIIKYRGRPDQYPFYNGIKVYTGVWCKTINDSTVRYTLFPWSYPNGLDMDPILFICRVDGEDVFFFSQIGASRMDFRNNNPFKWSDEDKERYKRKYFPELYEEGRINTGVIGISHPEHCHLTFINDRLVSKAYKRGMPFDRVKVRVGDKEYFW